jgi:hypothetical protein
VSKKQAERVAKMQPYKSFGSPSTLTLNPTPISSSGTSNPTPSFPPLNLLFTPEEMIELQGPTSQEIELHSVLAEELLTELIPSTGLSTDVTEQEVPLSLEQDSSPIDIDLAELSSCNPGLDFCHQGVIYIPPPVRSLCISHTRHTIVNTSDAHVLRAFISAGKHHICAPHTLWFEKPIDFSHDFLKECVAVIPPLTELAFLTTDSGPSDPLMLIVECLWRGMRFRLAWQKQFGFHLHPDAKPLDLIDQDVVLAPVSTTHSRDFFEEWHLKLREFVQLEGVKRYLQYSGLVTCILYQLLGELCLDKVIKGPLILFTSYGGYFDDFENACMMEIPLEAHCKPGLNVVLGGFKNPQVWVWPPLQTFEASCMWNGEWSEQAESWFLDCWDLVTSTPSEAILNNDQY